MKQLSWVVRVDPVDSQFQQSSHRGFIIDGPRPGLQSGFMNLIDLFLGDDTVVQHEKFEAVLFGKPPRWFIVFLIINSLLRDTLPLQLFNHPHQNIELHPCIGLLPLYQ